MAKNSGLKVLLSLGAVGVALAIAYAPIPGLRKTVVVVSGSELQEPLEELEARFEAENPNINLDIHIQGSQEMVNNYVDDRNDFTPTVLIPADSEILAELQQRWRSQGEGEPFYGQPQEVARTMLVAVAWPERGDVLFPGGEFDWGRLGEAVEVGNWSALGGEPGWGSFDFLMTDPTRSNSGQLSLGLWLQETELNGTLLTTAALSDPDIPGMVSVLRRSIYQPPRSTDILLQEFIVRGPNDADVATVYESIALARYEQSQANQNNSYRIYYLDPTIETVSTAAIVRRDVSQGLADTAQEFVEFLLAPEQQEVFVRYGFRPVDATLVLDQVSGSPWSQNIPGAQLSPSFAANSAPSRQVRGELQRLWERAN